MSKHLGWREVFEGVRENLGITKTELARRVGMSVLGVMKALRPGGNPTIRTMQRLTRALGADLSFAIFLREPEPPQPDMLTEFAATEEGRRMFEAQWQADYGNASEFEWKQDEAGLWRWREKVRTTDA